MALVKFGNGVANISGRIDGTVFSRVRGGAVARGWTKPINTPTPAQTVARSLFGASVAIWSGITDKAAWNAAASLLTRFNRLGEPYTPTGRQLAIEVNQNLSLVNQSTKTAPPPDLSAPGGILEGSSDVEVTAGALTTFSLTPNILELGVTTTVDATPVFPADQKTNFSNLFRRVGVADGLIPADLLPQYTSLFGSAAAVGDQIAVRYTPIRTDNGIAGPALIVVLTATAP